MATNQTINMFATRLESVVDDGIEANHRFGRNTAHAIRQLVHTAEAVAPTVAHAPVDFEHVAPDTTVAARPVADVSDAFDLLVDIEAQLHGFPELSPELGTDAVARGTDIVERGVTRLNAVVKALIERGDEFVAYTDPVEWEPGFANSLRKALYGALKRVGLIIPVDHALWLMRVHRADHPEQFQDDVREATAGLEDLRDQANFGPDTDLERFLGIATAIGVQLRTFRNAGILDDERDPLDALRQFAGAVGTTAQGLADINLGQQVAHIIEQRNGARDELLAARAVVIAQLATLVPDGPDAAIALMNDRLVRTPTVLEFAVRGAVASEWPTPPGPRAERPLGIARAHDADRSGPDLR